MYTWKYIQDCHGKSSVHQEEDSFHQQLCLKFKQETSELLHLERTSVRCWELDTSESKSEILLKCLKVQNDGEYQLDRSCGKCEVLLRVKEKRNTLNAVKRKANWIDHIFRENCLLKYVIETQAEGTGRRGWRKQLLRDLQEKRRYRKLKEEVQDRALRRTRFARGCGRVAGQVAERVCRDSSAAVDTA
jgi:hypothetical protein